MPVHEIGRYFLHSTDIGTRITMWAAFTDLNSSTRSEIGAVHMALAPVRKVNVGIDNNATVIKGTAVVEHQNKPHLDTTGFRIQITSHTASCWYFGIAIL